MIQGRKRPFACHVMTKAPSRVMLSAAKPPREPCRPPGHPGGFAALSMTREGTFFTACYIRSGVDHLACPVALGAVVVEVGADAVAGVGGDSGIGDGTGKSVVAGVTAA